MRISDWSSDVCSSDLAAGHDAREHAERIVRLAAEFRRRMSNPKDLVGTVRIGVIDTVVYSWLPALIERVREAYPAVVLELAAAVTPEISDDLQNGRPDLRAAARLVGKEVGSTCGFRS